MQYRVYITNLYDIYGELLTEKQQAYFEDYYLDNLTFQEISENKNVSRNAIFSQIKEAEEKMKHLESVLKCLEKKQALLDLISKYDTNIKNEIQKIIE